MEELDTTNLVLDTKRLSTTVLNVYDKRVPRFFISCILASFSLQLKILFGRSRSFTLSVAKAVPQSTCLVLQIAIQKMHNKD